MLWAIAAVLIVQVKRKTDRDIWPVFRLGLIGLVAIVPRFVMAVGAGLPQLVAFLTAWSVLALHRVLMYEAALMGWLFSVTRLTSSLILAPDRRRDRIADHSGDDPLISGFSPDHDLGLLKDSFRGNRTRLRILRAG